MLNLKRKYLILSVTSTFLIANIGATPLSFKISAGRRCLRPVATAISGKGEGLPKVFIIILNYNGREDTEECIESLKK